MASTVSEITSLWEAVKNRIKDRVYPDIYDAFFASTAIQSMDGKIIKVSTKSQLAQEILTNKYKKEMVDPIVQEIFQSDYEVEFFYVDEEVLAAAPEKPVERPKFFAENRLKENYTFKNFVTGPSNLSAYQGAVIVSQGNGAAYNPLFIYGGSGLGKTHLLNAIGNAYANIKTSAKVLSITSDDFFDEYVKFINGEKRGDELRDFFKTQVDMLLVDDIQFLRGKTKTEEMFFTVFNSLISQNKQVVITSDTHPEQLEGFDKRLLTRFSQGLTVSVNVPDTATAESILKNKIEALQLDINRFDPEVISFFAERFSSNVRELEGRLTRLIFYITNIKPVERITLDVAREAVQDDIEAKNEKSKLSEEKIIQTVADYFHLGVSQVTGKNRTGQIALARHVAMYLIRDLLDLPFAKIGEAFGGKDHATVMNGVQKVEKSMRSDPDLKKTVTTLKAKLKN